MKSKNIIIYLGVVGFIFAVLLALVADSQRMQVIAGVLITLSLMTTAAGWAVYRGKT